jgi:hypothetical protein
VSVKESFERAILDGRTLAVIVIVAILWRTYISLNDTIPPITFWESFCSGIALIIFGWVLFAYTYHMFKIQKGWPISNWIYQGIAVSMVSINVYVLIYYGMRWFRLLQLEEAYLPLDFLFRDIRFIALVVFYCAILWSAKYVKKMHEDYIAESKGKAFLHLISPYLYPTAKKLREMNVRELVGTVITDERTLLVIVGLTFLWRLVISIDYNIALWESMCSGIALFVLGWLFFAYICSMSKKQKGWLALAKAYHGIALGVIAINIYVLVYYGMRWYRIVGLGGVAEAFVPLDFLFRDARYFALVIFYCASIVLSKFLKRAYEEYRLISSEAKTHQ